MRLLGTAALQGFVASDAEQRLQQVLADLEHRVLETREALDRAEVDMAIFQEAEQADPIILLLEQEQIRRLGAARAAWCKARSAAEQGRLSLRVLGCVQRRWKGGNAG